MSNYLKKITYCKTGCCGHSDKGRCDNIDTSSSMYPYTKYFCSAKCIGHELDFDECHPCFLCGKKMHATDLFVSMICRKCRVVFENGEN